MTDPLRLMLELRPALDGFSGIPQEVRLLFRGLALQQGVELQGLVQSANLPIAPGLHASELPPDGQALSGPQLARTALVVASLQQGPSATRWEHRRKMFLMRAGPVAAALWSTLGGRVALSEFAAREFQDYVWRALFAKSLLASDLDLVTRQRLRILRWPWGGFHAFGVATAGLGRALYPRLDTQGVDIFIAETPFPGRVSGATRMVVRYHDAMPVFMTHTVKNRGLHLAMHFEALRRNAADGAWFACVSDAARGDLLRIVPEATSRAVTIPNIVSDAYGAEDANLLSAKDIVRSRREGGSDGLPADRLGPGRARSGALKYLLAVSTIEPRKNHLGLLHAFEYLRGRGMTDLHLVCVGGEGWDSGDTMAQLRRWSGQGWVHLLSHVPAPELRCLYQQAAATVCPSFAEGFDFSGAEALRCGGVVAASDIPVHREVLGDAAAYFPTYSPTAMAEALAQLLAPQAVERRQNLRQQGLQLAQRYGSEAVMAQWWAFLQRVRSGR